MLSPVVLRGVSLPQLGYFAHGYSKRYAFGPAQARRISAEGQSALSRS